MQSHMQPHEQQASRRDLVSVSNRYKVPVRFQVRARPGTGLLQRVSTHNPLLKRRHCLLQSSIGVLIVSWHNLYVKYVVWCPLSSPVLRLAFGPILVESQWKPGHFGVMLGLISKRFNECWSERESENGRWNRAHFAYRSCCDMIRIEILDWRQWSRNRKMEQRFGSNQSPNPVVTPAFGVTTRTGPSGTVRNPDQSVVTWNRC